MTAELDGSAGPSTSLQPKAADVSGSIGPSAGASIPEPATLAADSAPAGDLKQRLEFANEQAEYLNSYIQFADTKAGVTFTLAAGVLGFLISTKDFVRISRGDAPIQYSWLNLAALAVLVVSAVLSLWVVFPRSKSSGDKLFSWVDVAEFKNPGDYVKHVAAQTDEAIATARLTHCYYLSQLCAIKYKVLAWSMGVGAVGVFLTFFYWMAIS